MPKSKVEWWTAKIGGNKARDARVEKELCRLGWHVVTLWACAVKTRGARDWLEARLPVLIGGPVKAAAPLRAAGSGLSSRVAEE